MSYIAPENLTLELQNKLKKIDELELSVEKLEDNPMGIEVLNLSQNIVIQNSDLSFDPDLILVNNYIHYSVDNQIPSPTEFKVYYILSNQQGSLWEHNEIELLPPSSVMVNLINFPEEHLPYIQYIHIDTIKDGVITNSKQIPIVRNGKDGIDGKDGVNGKDGEVFTFDDLTPEQIELLRGAKGDTGEKGDTGDNNIEYYNASGLINKKIKVFTAEVEVVADGKWTCNYEHVKFEEVLSISVTPLHEDVLLSEQAVGGSVNYFDKNYATGTLVKSASSGVLLAMTLLHADEVETRASIKVTGY